MAHNWQQLLFTAHTHAFRVVKSSPRVTDRICGLTARAIKDGITLEAFHYLAEKEVKNGNAGTC